ncbi:hypothetical protein [Ruegeria sp. HKCCD8929]|uniref:hypothetical protein n=1 Tax=Ruegeria sp. HKCCD8929 TaxID=2683006 RepID=UPI001C2BAB29|nr:hypothetical protein [Ruegeria sp. HKCCD8929]
MGWAINGSGEVYRTDNGAKTWSRQERLGRSYLRCIGMANQDTGWIGCTTPNSQVFMTTNGGGLWTPVPNLPCQYNDRDDADAPEAVCGLHVLNETYIFASGANNPEVPARFLKSSDGGVTWRARDMEDVASCLIDIFFQTPEIGWVVGGRATRPHPRRSDILPVVLKTVDGGKNWVNMLGPNIQAPLGEWGWKIQFVTDQFVVVALENFKAGAILISEDGGDNWERIEIRDDAGDMINGNLEGIGFLDRATGWVGGWGDVAISSGRTSGTTDGGRTWTDLTQSWPAPLAEESCPNDVDRGQYLNRFRFVDGFGYASGNTIYKYTDEEIEDFDPQQMQSDRLLPVAGNIGFTDNARIPIEVKPGTSSLTIDIYDRFAGRVRTLVDERDPSSGRHTLTWDLTDDNGRSLDARQHLVRVVADGESDSRLIVRQDGKDRSERRHQAHLLHMLEGS